MQGLPAKPCHTADPGFIVVVIADGGAGHAEAAQRCREALRLAGDAITTGTQAFRAAPGQAG